MVGGGAFVGDAFPRSSRAFWRVYFRSRRKSPPSICTDLPVPNVSHAIENQLEDDLHPPFLASSCSRKATPLPFEQGSHRTETAHGVLLLRRGPRGRHLGIMSPRLFFHGAACIPVVPSIHTAIPRLIFARRRHAFRNAAPSVALVTANPHV